QREREERLAGRPGALRRLEHRAAIGLELPAEVLDLDAGQAAREPVDRARAEPAGEALVALAAPAGGDLGALLERVEQLRDLLGRVLQVAVERHRDLAARREQAAGQGGRLPEVARELEHADRRVLRL